MLADFHSLKIEACLKLLKSSPNGLTDAQAKKRIKKYGYNELPKERPLGRLTIFFSQFKSPLIYILLAAGVISLFLREYIDSGVIFGAVIINTVIGYLQENKANNSLNKLKKLVEFKSIVLRGGRKQEVDSRQVSIGDIIIIKSGNRIPADARLLEVEGLLVNEAPLTGESVPSEKNLDIQKKGASIADRENMVYAGTTAVKGLGKAVVCAIGQETEIGKIAKLVKATSEEKTPLQKRLSNFSNFLGAALAAVSFLVVVVGILQNRSVFEMFIMGIALAVASIPEGLVVAVTVILVLGMQRILKEKALTRKLVAAETLGSTTVICADKTGTLTEGKMYVAHIVIGEKEFELKTLGSRQDTVEAKAVSLALQTAMMCNDASIENPDDELSSWRIIGAPTEAALLSAAVQSGLNKRQLLKVEPKVNELPFTSELKYMLSLHKRLAGGRNPKRTGGEFILYEKGAPEKLLAKSTKFYHQGKIRGITKKEREKLNNTYRKLTNKGLRVIGTAVREINNIAKLGIKEDELGKLGEKEWGIIDNDLTFVGFIALKDPLRPDAKETIAICRQAGIRPVMITGDHQLTARAIAAEVGLKVKRENIATGEHLDKMDDKKLRSQVNKIDIYARVSPHHKLRIVKALRARGEVVAMTGDGINDSPALKAADIGISLGTGTDIAKEASDMVLLDNHFKTIVAAVREGRIIFANIRKVITYLISDSFSEVILIVGSIMLGAPLAVLPAQILWINIVNDGFPHFSLAFEKGNSNIMREKPIKKNEPILNREMKVIIFGVGVIRDVFTLALFLYLFYAGTEIIYLRTIFFAILGVKSLLSIFSLRDFRRPIWRLNPFSNSVLVWAAAASSLLMLAAIYWPPLQNILSTSPLRLRSWLWVMAVAIVNIIMIEAVKRYFAPAEKRVA